MHKTDGVHDWKPAGSYAPCWEPLPHLFQHSWYVDYDQYPHGAADMAGYWAEAQILGGVVLFDRRNPAENPDADQNAVYLHPDRYEAPYRIVKLLPEQRQALLDFLVGESDPTAPLLPIMVDKNNTERVDPEDPIRETGICRDLWERRDFPPDARDMRLRDVWDRFQFPTEKDRVASSRRAYERKWRIQEMDREMYLEEEAEKRT